MLAQESHSAIFFCSEGRLVSSVMECFKGVGAGGVSGLRRVGKGGLHRTGLNGGLQWRNADCRCLSGDSGSGQSQTAQAMQTLVRRILQVRRQLVFGLQVVVGEHIEVGLQRLRRQWLTGQVHAQGRHF